MTTLRSRLADLAEQVDLPPTDPSDLWRRGRRHGRRRAAATAASALVVGLVAGLGVAGIVTRPARVEPAAPEGRTVLPDRFFEPSGRLPLAHGGGPLVAVVPTARFSWVGRNRPGLIGISAVTQRYGFVDLPGWIGLGAAPETTWSLSPNGRWVAYWYGDREAVEGVVPADGIAVLDTRTGEIRRDDLESDLGVSPEQVAWSGDRLWFTEWDYTDGTDLSSATLVASLSWDLDSGDPRQVDDPDRLLSRPLGPAGTDGFLAIGRADRWFAIDDSLQAPVRVARIRISGNPGLQSASLSPDGRRLAVASSSALPGAQISLVTVGGDDAEVRPLSSSLSPYSNLIGWRDDGHLLVEVADGKDRRLVSADVDTGDVETLSTYEQTNHDDTQYAVDLLRSPVVAAVTPPRPLDPRVVGLGAGALVLVLILVVRRRRRRAL